MKVDVAKKNPSLESLFNDPDQVITLDANFLIPPDRPNLSSMSISFSKFQTFWLDPIFKTFLNLAIHEAVRDELVSKDIKTFIQNKADATPPQIIIHKDSELTSVEMMLRDSIEDKIFPLTQYDPQINNRDDCGEVKTLAYIAVKGLLYFAAHDFNALQLVEMAESWSTGLDTVQAIKMYEIIFYLCVRTPSLRKSLRMLYKYQYYLTKNEKSTNPEWESFVKSMESMYRSHL
ncbi:MAG: hypothetical protein CVV46_14160 [Spirochaetae bacterium HGW-Spirochaetae-2]|jgi:hypothetical protein|nr:MAG: hypothetical protein CVV46_14160 [Spirochaetae bacterium HGW-Spirochaetae-2]